MSTRSTRPGATLAPTAPSMRRMSPPLIGIIGIDVAKDTLAVADGPDPQAPVRELANTKPTILAWLKTLPAGTSLALEATGAYHLLLCELAHQRGFTLYLLNPKDFSRYAQALRSRAKTDRGDAALIARFATNEQAHLQPYVPLPREQQELLTLIRRRATVVAARAKLRQSLRGLQPVARELKAVLSKIDALIAQLEAQVDARFARCPQQQAQRQRLATIVGVGPCTSAALVATLNRGAFKNADAFVAYIGLDLKVRDSGQKQGRRRLTKRGDGEMRRLLYTAAMSASLTTVWRPLYLHTLERGFTRVQALVILARRIARTAWSLYQHGTTFCPQRLTHP